MFILKSIYFRLGTVVVLLFFGFSFYIPASDPSDRASLPAPDKLVYENYDPPWQEDWFSSALPGSLEAEKEAPEAGEAAGVPPADPLGQDNIVRVAGSGDFIDQPVLFTAQAPLGEWDDPRQQDGCEEASVLMAMAWAQGFEIDGQRAKAMILAMSRYQEENYDSYVDTSAMDTQDRLIRNYYGHLSSRVVYDFTYQDIIEALRDGSLVLVPTNGRVLANPYYTAPGPERHMLLIRGYDPLSHEFITNDPGTRRGRAFRYAVDRLMRSIQDYPTGEHLPADERVPAMIIVSLALTE